MKSKQAFRGLRILFGVLLLLLCTTPGALKARQSDAGQAGVIAHIALAVVTCSAHPCLGDSDKEVRKELHNRIVSDGTSYYSNITEAYPPSQEVLSGVVEWDLAPKLNFVSLKITNFQADPSVFLSELEHALPGCDMERDDDGATDSADDDDEGEEDSTREWSCLAQGLTPDDLLIEVYYVHGLLLLEMGS